MGLITYGSKILYNHYNTPISAKILIKLITRNEQSKPLSILDVICTRLREEILK